MGSPNLPLYLQVSSADNFCKQIEPISGLTKCWVCSGSKQFDTLTVLLKEFFKKVDFEKILQMTKKHEKLPRQRFKCYLNVYKAFPVSTIS